MKFLVVASLAFANLAFAQQDDGSYDYIVVGGGPAGLVASERFAESGKKTLLIERGHASFASSGGRAIVGWNGQLTGYDIPSYAGQLHNTAVFNDPDGSPWCTDTASTAACILGGGSSVNIMQYIHPQDADFERFPTGWKAADMREAAAKLYARIPGSQTPSQDGKIYDVGSYQVLSKMYTNAGYRHTTLANANDKQNVFTHPFTFIKNGLRDSAVREYLPLAQQRPNFRLMLNAKMIRAVRNGPKVTGVVVAVGNQRQTITLSEGGKLVLAAGAMSTPRLLFNSGIGPTAQIQQVQSNGGVKLPPQRQWINLPVGMNARNDAEIHLEVNSNTTFPFKGQPGIINPSPADKAAYNQRKSGFLAQSPFERFQAWTSARGPDGQTRWFHMTGIPHSPNRIGLTIVLTHGATSLGQLVLDGNGNTVWARYPILLTPADRTATAQMINKFFSFADAPGSGVSYTGSRDTNALLQGAQGGIHYLGTAKMGPDDGRRNGGTSVVDANTKVYGTDNLFIVDGSIHPDQSTGNPTCIIMVVAEKAAEKIMALQ